MAQTGEFMFKNVAYRPTVYRTGNVAKVYEKESHLFYLLTYLFIIFIYVLLDILVRGGFKSLSSTFYRLNYPINFPTTFSQSIVVCHEYFAVHKYSLTYNIIAYCIDTNGQINLKKKLPFFIASLVVQVYEK